MYGLLAVCAALVLGTHDWSGDADRADVTRLAGRTSDGARITMGVMDGKLESFDTHVRVHCPGGETRRWRWYPADGAPVPFDRDGPHFRVLERADRSHARPPVVFTNEMRGRLSDGRYASGTITAGAVWGRGHDSVHCAGRARFSARRR